MFDNTHLKTELAHIHHALSGVAASARGKRLLEEVRRQVDGATTALLWQCLFADCLRVVYSAVAADDEIDDHEIESLYEFLFTVVRHYANAVPDYYGDLDGIDHEDARSFLTRYASDTRPFGRGGTLRWPGLTVCRKAAALDDVEPLERYERLMTWLISAACRVGGVTESSPRWRSRVSELTELRGELARGTKAPAPQEDLRIQAFLAPSRAFAAIQQASSVYESDPFDVEAIHAEARATFEEMVERATAAAQHSDRGRMLLVLGDSGAGKTHLLRGFRKHVHEYGRGFVVYAQLHSNAADYARYLLHHVVDSLARPYAGPAGERTGLHELASGLPRLVGEPLTSLVARLSDDIWESTESLAGYINGLVDELLRQPALSTFDPDLLRVLLYAIHPDQRTTSRVYKYLRCESMTAHDRRWIGDVAPRVESDDPNRMIRQLARLAFVTQRAAFVLMVDQAELAIYEDAAAAATAAMVQRAIDTLHGIVSQIPSAIAVVSCLSDLYVAVRPRLNKYALDRLEKDPPTERLQINRSYPEIEAIISRRLAWLFDEAGAVYRPETPVYPIPENLLRGLTNRRTRDVLEWCHEYQTRCAAAGRIIDAGEEDVEIPEPDTAVDLDQIAAAWNDAAHAPDIDVPDDEDQILTVVSAAAKACAEESGLSLTTPPRKNGTLRVQLGDGVTHAEMAIAITNNSYRGGFFAGQIDSLRRSAKGATPVAVRTLEFPHGESSNNVIAGLLKAGGRRVYVDGSTLRTLVAFQQFKPSFPADRIEAWRRRDRPISSLSAVAEIFDLGRLRIAASPVSESAARVEHDPPAPPQPPAPVSGTSKRASTAPPVASAEAKPTTSAATAEQPPPENGTSTKRVDDAALPPPSSKLHLGKSPGFHADPRELELGSLLRHTGILGSSGSGKTTLALNLIEQSLERGVAVILLDRKGDLAGYAKPDWWQHTADPERARRLAEQIDVRLFTPGTRGGRPLSLSVVPDLANVPEHEHDRMLQYAAQALGAMMRLGNGSADAARLAILTQAIAVLAGRRRPGGLAELIALLEEGDDELLARAGRYDEKLFKKLVQDLETVRLSDADLFDPAAEPLSAETLIGRRPGGKVPLAIASTRFLGDVERIQSWVAHLIGCLSRHVAKSPSAELHTLFMIDEADVFMPAGTTKPPSKEPLQDLLKRARAAGLGVVLASQSPADFDYRSREQINTWFLGRIADKRSIEKMKPLFEHRPQVRGKLAGLEAGRFVLLQDGNASDLERAPSLLRTEQLSEATLMAMAARDRPRRP